ncbi:hypothetical protein Tco_1015536 [Tanacetum coccineum]|uniref:Uncharacterized protein n=1 Tax=Tanacetum coccineum TaxID=301880 RepID=A0ABQ5FL29_9ASTR
MVPRKILTRSGLISLNSARQSHLNAVCCCCSRQVNTARPKAVVNVVRKNQVNAVKASACWVWMPKNRVIDHVSKNNSASVTLKRLDYIDAQGRFKWMHKFRGGKSAAKKKKNPEKSAAKAKDKEEKKKTVEGLKTAGYKVTTAGSRLLLLVKKLMLFGINKNEKRIFSEAGDGVRIYPDGVFWDDWDSWKYSSYEELEKK